MTHVARDHATSTSRGGEAIRWFVLLRSGEPSLEELQEWHVWVGDAGNRRAYEAVRRVWQHSGLLGGLRRATLPELQQDDYDGSMPVFAHVARAASPPASRPSWLIERIHVMMSSRVVRMAAVAGVLGIAALRLFGDLLPSFGITEQLEVYETGVAQHREVVLGDGSRIALGAKTAVSVRYASDRRTVVLDRGEALFQVARDPQRPFSVFAGYGTITALGTVFAVRRDEDRLVVSVTEGKVQVAERPPTIGNDKGMAAAVERPALRKVTVLAQGEQVSYGNTDQSGVVQRAEPEAATAWREGQLRYRDEPLRYVIQDLNRYSYRQIVIGDRAAEELRFTGTVQQHYIDSWLRALESIFPVEVVETDSDHVLLRSRTEPQP